MIDGIPKVANSILPIGTGFTSRTLNCQVRKMVRIQLLNIPPNIRIENHIATPKVLDTFHDNLILTRVFWPRIPIF